MVPGNVVVLKSGGPQMTVESIEDELVYCTWFDKNRDRKRDSFFESSLEDIKDVERRNREQMEKFSARSRSNRIFL